MVNENPGLYRNPLSLLGFDFLFLSLKLCEISYHSTLFFSCVLFGFLVSGLFHLISEGEGVGGKREENSIEC